MHRIVVFLTMTVFVFSGLFLIGCGGKSQKINGAADEQSEIMDEAMEAERQELPTTYLVEPGDKLWTIAAKPEIYGNKYQWPLIYDANRDILDDYRGIESGQKLIIPRNVSAVEIAAAKERAEELNWPSASASTEVASAEDSDSELIVASGGVSEDYETESYENEDYSASYEEQQEDAMEVAGLDDTPVEESAAGGFEEEETYGGGYGGGDEGMGLEEDAFFEETTPIPEPREKSGGGINFGLILIILLLAVAGAVVFILMKRKKEEGEDEPPSGEDDSSNILG